MLAPAVQQAIRELEESFPGIDFRVVADGQGGAGVTGHEFLLGDRFKPDRSWIGFAITFQYPAADVYPHFMRPDVTRLLGGPIPGDGLSLANWQGTAAVQISRRSNGWNQQLDTAAIKLTKVLSWLHGT